MRIQRAEAFLYFPVVIIGGMCVLGGLAWVYEKTRKKIEHPRLGILVFFGDYWAGVTPHYLAGRPAVEIEIPGTRQGPNAEDLARFETLWVKIASLVDSVRPYALEDLEDAHDAVVGTNFEAETRAVIERVASVGGNLDSDWVLSAVSLHEGLRGGRHWCLQFDVSWDAEHQRAAYLDLDGRFLRYDLSCTVVDL